MLNIEIVLECSTTWTRIEWCWIRWIPMASDDLERIDQDNSLRRCNYRKQRRCYSCSLCWWVNCLSVFLLFSFSFTSPLFSLMRTIFNGKIIKQFVHVFVFFLLFSASHVNCKWIFVTHRIRTYDIMIKAGEWQLGVDDVKPFQTRRVVKVTMHPAYQPTNLESDIALLHLESNLNFDKHIGPICVDSNDVDLSLPNEECVTSGWGKEAIRSNWTFYKETYKLNMTLIIWIISQFTVKMHYQNRLALIRCHRTNVKLRTVVSTETRLSVDDQLKTSVMLTLVVRWPVLAATVNTYWRVFTHVKLPVDQIKLLHSLKWMLTSWKVNNHQRCDNNRHVVHTKHKHHSNRQCLLTHHKQTHRRHTFTRCHQQVHQLTCHQSANKSIVKW